MKIFFASDHAGFDLKNALVERVRAQGYAVEDLGAHALDPEDDYPDFITPLARRVAAEPSARGIILGGSGQGEAMAANRVSGIRAAVFCGGSLAVIAATRQHNDANVLSLGARFISSDEASEAVRLFIETPFSGEARHIRRIAKF